MCALGNQKRRGGVSEVMGSKSLEPAALTAGVQKRLWKLEFRNGDPFGAVNTSALGSSATWHARCSASLARRKVGRATAVLARRESARPQKVTAGASERQLGG